MPSRGISSLIVTYIAWDTVANTTKSGDVFNHTLRWIKDGTSSAPTNSPSEVDATNAPGVYKITLTGTETTCDIGTLAGKSSTANVTIIPLTISFELLPTNALGTNGAVSQIDGTGRVDANIQAINGFATNDNLATLKLKKLDVQNSDIAGDAVYIKSNINGTALHVDGSATGAIGAKITGYNSGLEIEGQYNALNIVGINNGYPAVTIQAEGQNAPVTAIYSTADGYVATADGLQIRKYQAGTGDDINADFGGSVGVKPKRNNGFNNFMFPMFDSTTKQPKSGLTVSAARAIDGSSYSPCSNSVVELSDGTYRINLSADDLNGDKIMFRFYATDADDQMVEIITQN